MATISVELPQDLQEFVETKVRQGRFTDTSDAVSAGIRLLVSNERLYQQVQKGVEQADRGDLSPHDVVFSHLKAMATDLQNCGGNE